MHSEESPLSSWTLLGLAVRIARGMRLHRDGDGASWDAFHAEMRRRLWRQLVVLDVNMSNNRASEPLISDGSFTTTMPLNIDDHDFDQESSQPIKERTGTTEMILPLTYMSGLNILRTLNHAHSSVQAKADLADTFSDKLESTYLGLSGDTKGGDPPNGHEWLAYLSGQLMSLMMWLVVQYPLRSHAPNPDDFPKSQALRTAVALLILKDRIERESSASCFLWWFRMFVPWHTLAVATI